MIVRRLSLFTFSNRTYRITALFLLLIVAGALLWFYLLTPPLLLAQLNQPFTLQIKQTAELDHTDLRITWVSFDDRRCSLCTATSYATVTLHLQVAGQPATEQELSPDPFVADYPDALAFAGYQIQVLDLTPTPINKYYDTPRGTYRLHLQVTRLATK